MSASTANSQPFSAVPSPSQQSPRTASVLQIEANRRNAQLSTGPRTPEGKTASAANSSKSGLFAAQLNVRQNEATEYEAMRDSMLDTIRPMGAFEESLALQLINANWRLRRCTAVLYAVCGIILVIPSVPLFRAPATSCAETSVLRFHTVSTIGIIRREVLREHRGRARR